jgi:hypothetical protein
MSTITYRQDNPTVRIAMILACMAVICALLLYVFGLTDIVRFGDWYRETFGILGAVIIALIVFPPGFVLVRYLTPKHEVVFGNSALTIKGGREQKLITYAKIGSMVFDQLTSRRLELYDHAGRLLHCFRTGMDEAALSSIVRLITGQIEFDARNEQEVVRYVRR